MLCVSAARGFHARALRQLVARSHVTAAPRGPTLSAGCVRGQQLCAAGRRSLLTLNRQVQSNLPSTRCFITAPKSKEDGDLIYHGTMGSALRGGKVLTYTSPIASLILMPHILLNTDFGVAFSAFVCFHSLTPLLLHRLTQSYVERLYHRPDSDTYTAITYTILASECRVVFRQQDVRVPSVPTRSTNFYVGQTHLRVNPDLFVLPQDYNHLMGYDKLGFDANDAERPGAARELRRTERVRQKYLTKKK